MATTTARNKGKTEFVKEVLGKNPRANTTAVNEAWTSAGRDGIDQRDPGQQAKVVTGVGGQPPFQEQEQDRSIRQSKRRRTPARNAVGSRRSMTTRDRRFARIQSNGRKTEQPANKVELRGKTNRHHGSLEELEADIDRLLFKVMGLGGLSAIEESLRRTRRLLYGGFAV